MAIPATVELMDGAQRWRQRRKIDLAKFRFGIVEAPDQQQAPRLEMARMSGVRPVAMRFEGRGCRGERFGGPGEVARGERDFGLDDDAPRAGHGLPRAEGAPGPPHQRFRFVEIAELGHRDAAKRERRRVVAQRHPVQRGEWIARGKRPCRCGDQRIHPDTIRNPVTLVTPAIAERDPNLSTTTRIKTKEQGERQ